MWSTETIEILWVNEKMTTKCVAIMYNLQLNQIILCLYIAATTAAANNANSPSNQFTSINAATIEIPCGRNDAKLLSIF